jgi:hypothetical protein
MALNYTNKLNSAAVWKYDATNINTQDYNFTYLDLNEFLF